MHSTKYSLFLLGLIVILSSGCIPPGGYYPYSNGYPSSGDSRLKLCIKYQADYGWSTGYNVSASVMKGTVLNQKTGTYNYNTFSTYVVVFWAQGEATIIELSYYFGSFSAIPISGTDKTGRAWQVAQTDFCY